MFTVPAPSTARRQRPTWHCARSHGGNRGVIPRVRRHVGISVGLGQVRAAALLRQQAEEDGRRLGAGDLAVRLHRAVRITDDVGEVVVRVQTEGIVIRNLNGGRGGSGTVNAFPLRGISYVSSHGFSNRWRPAHKRVTAASGVAVKSRCGAVLFDDADLVGKDFFVLHAVSVGDGAHQAVRSLERIVGSTRFSVILIIVSSAIFLLRPTSCPTIFLIAIIVPAGDLLAVTGQFPVAGHTLCIWKRKRIIAESKEIIAAVSCLIVVQSTSPGSGSTGRIHINTAAHACLITLHSAALGNGNSGFISINAAADRLIGRPVSLRHRLCLCLYALPHFREPHRSFD